jgi:hypothetical protein
MGFAKIFILVLIFHSLNFGHSAICPPDEITYPCDCGSSNSIGCTINKNYDLFYIFKNIDNYYNNSTILYDFYIHGNDYITEVEENVFRRISFQMIRFNSCSKLSRFHPNAFSSSYSVTTYLNFEQLNLTNVNASEVFDMLSSFTNLEEGYLTDSKLPLIPDGAFAISYPIGEQTKLKKLDFSYNLIKSVGNFAFMGLQNLTTLRLYKNRIDFIGEDSFRFATSSTERLFLTLSNNALNGSSFEVGAFSYFERPVDLYMEYNYITYLDEAVFRPFLNQTVLNRLWLHGNPFVADCRMQWLVNDKELFEEKVLGATCQDGRNIFRYSPEEFAHCSYR